MRTCPKKRLGRSAGPRSGKKEIAALQSSRSDCRGNPSLLVRFSGGWRPDVPDIRDFPYCFRLGCLEQRPSSVDLSSKCPAVYDQATLGSCTANAIGAAYQFCQDKQSPPLRRAFLSWVPSRLFIYFNERAMEGTINVDAGAQLRDGIKSVVAQGVCPEKIWPYDISKFTKRPPVKCYDAALKDQVLQYSRITTIFAMKDCLAAGFPFVFGFSVYESFMSQATATTGLATMPKSSERLLGGHAVMAVGYDDVAQMFIVRNSWGTRWGKAGYFFMPYAYLESRELSDDFWTIRMVE